MTALVLEAHSIPSHPITNTPVLQHSTLPLDTDQPPSSSSTPGPPLHPAATLGLGGSILAYPLITIYFMSSASCSVPRLSLYSHAISSSKAYFPITSYLIREVLKSTPSFCRVSSTQPPSTRGHSVHFHSNIPVPQPHRPSPTADKTSHSR